MKEIKKCSKCKKNKAFIEFGASKQTKDGLKCYCKECKRKESAAWRDKNPDYNKAYRDKYHAEAIDYGREYYKENKKELYNKRKTALLQNPKLKEADNKRKKNWYETNKKDILSAKKQRYVENRDEIIKREWAYIKNSPIARLRHSLRNRFRNALNGKLKKSSVLDLIGCSLKELKIYLENKFQDKMSWENYGEWHIDHRLPLASFDLTTDEQAKKAFHYTNLQPLWAIDNLKKGASIPYKEEK